MQAVSSSGKAFVLVAIPSGQLTSRIPTQTSFAPALRT